MQAKNECGPRLTRNGGLPTTSRCEVRRFRPVYRGRFEARQCERDPVCRQNCSIRRRRPLLAACRRPPGRDCSRGGMSHATYLASGEARFAVVGVCRAAFAAAVKPDLRANCRRFWRKHATRQHAAAAKCRIRRTNCGVYARTPPKWLESCVEVAILRGFDAPSTTRCGVGLCVGVQNAR